MVYGQVFRSFFYLFGTWRLTESQSWCAENFSEQEHLASLNEKNAVYTAAGAGKLPFVSADDIARVGFHALTNAKPHNTDHLILGPELLSYDDVS